MRAVVAFALRRIRLPWSIAALRRYLNDPDGIVRREAIRWLTGFQVRIDALALFAAEAPIHPALSAEIAGTLLRWCARQCACGGATSQGTRRSIDRARYRCWTRMCSAVGA